MKEALTEFRERFGSTGPAEVFRAPGRVNLLGEHTDYNGGFVMPVALDRSTTVVIGKRSDRRVRVVSRQRGEAEFALDGLVSPENLVAGNGGWKRYVEAVAWALESSGFVLPGADLWIDSAVAEGAGLSSSAALEVAVALAWSEAAGHSLERRDLALLAQRAENEYVGVRCGVMDQYVASMAQAGTALLLDCRALTHRLLPISTQWALVVANTMVKHALGGEYNSRRESCERGVEILRRRRPEIRELRDVQMEDLEGADLPAEVAMRCRHVVLENQRALDGAAALDADDPERFGRMMYQSHASLRDDYEVSCAELDLMVDLARPIAGVYGSRMTGGGFGGSTVTLVTASAAERVVDELRREYEARTGVRPDVFSFQPGDGAGRVE